MNEVFDSHLSGIVIGAAIEVHRSLGPGLKEDAYEEALEHVLLSMGHNVGRQIGLPLVYKNCRLDVGYRIDLLVDGILPLELKSVEAIHPIHEAQLLTYLRIGQYPLGLLMNFNAALLKDGIRRRIQSVNWEIPELRAIRNTRDEQSDLLTGQILAAATEVHRNLGPGLLPSSYEEALCYELSGMKIGFARAYRTPLFFRDKVLESQAEIPLLVSKEVPVFTQCVDSLQSVHTSIVVSRLRQGNWQRGLLLNFNVESLANGIQRVSI